MALKSVLITGCSKGGAGSSLAFELQRQGLLVLATARNTAKIDPALAELPNVEVLQLDVASSASIAAAVKAVESRLSGRLDVLVNNAGFAAPGPAVEVDLDAAREMFDTNFWGPLAVTQAFMPLLIRSKGMVANNSSIGGFMNQPFNGLYAASKAALSAVGETMRLELAPYGVKVLTFASGGIRTEFFANSPLELRSDSLWKKVESNARSSLRGDDNFRMPVEKFAEAVVRDILAGADGIVCRGGASSMIRFISSYLPTLVLDRLLLNGTGLEKLP